MKFRAIRYSSASVPATLHKTIELIGQGIKSGAKYPPLRIHAARVASSAPPKNYRAQALALFDDFTRRWRYVQDPLGTEYVTTTGPQIYQQVLGFEKQAPYGYGDCDDATIGLGALFRAIGFDVAINTMARAGQRALFSHVYPSVNVPGIGWIAADPVGFPVHGFGWIPPAARVASWDLEGNLIHAAGQFPKAFNAMKRGKKMIGSFGGIDTEKDFQDFGLENYGLAGLDGAEPAEWGDETGLIGFGAYLDRPLPMLDNSGFGLLMEMRDDDATVTGPDRRSWLYRTKVLQMSPADILHVAKTGRPRPGAVALSDDGKFYQWQETPLGGFFSRLWGKVKKVAKKITGGVKKLVKGGIKLIGKAARAVIKKLPGGKYLLKIYGRIKQVAMKIVKPLIKILGPIAKKLAPIVALIPGYGTVAAAALYKFGDIAKIAQKYAVLIDDEGRPKFKSGEQAKKFKDALGKRAAFHQKELKKRLGTKKGKTPRAISSASKAFKLPAFLAKKAAMRGFESGVPYWRV